MYKKLTIEETHARIINEDPETRKDRHASAKEFIKQKIFSSFWYENLDQDIKDIYTTYPPWEFYTLKSDDTIPVRHSGIIKQDVGFFVNAVVNDKQQLLNVSDIIQVDNWTHEQFENIKKSINPSVMSEPVAFVTSSV
jgi:hypothetical protein